MPVNRLIRAKGMHASPPFRLGERPAQLRQKVWLLFRIRKFANQYGALSLKWGEILYFRLETTDSVPIKEY